MTSVKRYVDPCTGCKRKISFGRELDAKTGDVLRTFDCISICPIGRRKPD